MRRNEDGSVTFDRGEVRLLRAAMFTMEHYADTVWDASEIHAVSGYPVEQFRAARQAIDDLGTPEDRLADSLDRVGVNVALFEAADDAAFTKSFRLKALRHTVDEALSLGIPVSDRLIRLAQTD